MIPSSPLATSYAADFPPTTSLPLTLSPYVSPPQHSFLIVPSPTYTPTSHGDSCIIASYSLPSMMPHFFRARDGSPQSILDAITALHTRVSIDYYGDDPLRAIIIDPAYLDPTDAAVSAHSLALGYHVIARTPHHDDDQLPPFIHPIASVPPDDPRALHMMKAAYDCLFSERFTSHEYGRLSNSSFDLLELARTHLTLEPIPTTWGIMSRFQLAMRCLPDPSHYFQAPTYSNPMNEIMSLYFFPAGRPPGWSSTNWSNFFGLPRHHDTPHLRSCLSCDTLMFSGSQNCATCITRAPPCPSCSMPVYSGLQSCDQCIALDNAPPESPLDDHLESDDSDIPSLVSSDDSDNDPDSDSSSSHQYADASYPSPPFLPPDFPPDVHPFTGAPLLVSDILGPERRDRTMSDSPEPVEPPPPLPSDPAVLTPYGYLPLACYRNGLDSCATCIEIIGGHSKHLQRLLRRVLAFTEPSHANPATLT